MKPDSPVMWSLIDSARTAAADDLDAQMAHLEQELSPLELGQIAEVQDQVEAALQAANTWDLWGAAYLINGGASDDGFLYFRGWLLMQGRATFEAALADADSLANHPGIVPDECECQDIMYLAYRVYENKAGQELAPELTPSTLDQATSGEIWDEGELEERFPRLWAAFGAA